MHDWDAVQIPVLVDMEWNGEPRKLLLHANRNGFFYVLDRTDGEFLMAKAFAEVTWTEEFTPEGSPIVLSGTAPTPEGNYACPGVAGATNWMSPSFQSADRLALHCGARAMQISTSAHLSPSREGLVYWGSSFQPPADEKAWGAVRALDPKTGDIRWEFKHHSAPWAGTLSTAGGLVFTGDMEGYLIALDAATGEALWNFPAGWEIKSNPMTYEVDGRQYVVIASGASLTAFALPEAGESADRSGPAADDPARR